MNALTIPTLNSTESELLGCIAALDYPKKLKDRVINLSRRAFRLWRAALLLEEMVTSRKDRKRNG